MEPQGFRVVKMGGVSVRLPLAAGAVVEELAVQDACAQVPEDLAPREGGPRRGGGEGPRRAGAEEALEAMVGPSILDADLVDGVVQRGAPAGSTPRKVVDSPLTDFGARMERGDVRPEDRERLEALLRRLDGGPTLAPINRICLDLPAHSAGQPLLLPVILPRREEPLLLMRGGSEERKRKVAADPSVYASLFTQGAVGGLGLGMKTEAQDAVGALAGGTRPRFSQLVVPDPGAAAYRWVSALGGGRCAPPRPDAGLPAPASPPAGSGVPERQRDVTSSVEVATSLRRCASAHAKAPVTCVVCRAARGESEMLGCPQGHRVCWKTERGDAPVCVRKLQMLGFKAMHGRNPNQADNVKWITGFMRSWAADVAPKLFRFSSEDSGEEHFCAICFFTEQGARLKAVRKDMETDSMALVPYWKALRPHGGEERDERDAVSRNVRAKLWKDTAQGEAMVVL